MAFPLRDGGYASFPAFAVESAFVVPTQASSAGADSFTTLSLDDATELLWFGLLPDGLWSLEPVTDCQANDPVCPRNLEDFKQVISVQLSFGVVGDG